MPFAPKCSKPVPGIPSRAWSALSSKRASLYLSSTPGIACMVSGPSANADEAVAGHASSAMSADLSRRCKLYLVQTDQRSGVCARGACIIAPKHFDAQHVWEELASM